MGIYVNPGNDSFRKAVRSEIYVDKTELIACTNRYLDTEQQFICVSRPRRFGKSMALAMLAAYYSCGCDSRELFAGRKIEHNPSFAENLNQHHVICMNMQQFLTSAKNQDITDYLEREVLEEVFEEYGNPVGKTDIGLADALSRIYARTGRRFIFLMDEWDCVMRERQESEDIQRQYMDFLRNLLKDRPYVELAYMTGILPVKKYGQHSALNMFWEYSMTGQGIFEEYTGFTHIEVCKLCERYGMDFAQAGSWYDGYRFRKFHHIYNPKSVVEAMHRHQFANYWTSTETYDALKIYMDMDFDGLRASIVQMLGGVPVRVNILSFQNDMCSFRTKDDVLTLLVHLGYLAYDSEKEETFIPNREIAREFENAMSAGGWKEIMHILQESDRLLAGTLRGDENQTAQALDKAHIQAASILAYNDENSLACAICLAYYSARKDYKMIRELPAGHGFADIVFLPRPFCKKPALIIELKYDKSADGAIRQIKDRQYVRALEGFVGEAVLVGVNYDKNSPNKPYTCSIEPVLLGKDCGNDKKLL